MIRKAEFIKSYSRISDYEQDSGSFVSPEIAIAGRSNVGKSSFINMLTAQKKLAKTSSTPGRTRLINLFKINDGEYTIVDLPGYGYAKAAKSVAESFRSLTDSYFASSKRLFHTIVLVDIRHEPSVLDRQMVGHLYSEGKPFTIVATKCDKLSRAQLARARSVIAGTLKVGTGNIILSSAESGMGREEVISRIESVLA